MRRSVRISAVFVSSSLLLPCSAGASAASSVLDEKEAGRSAGRIPRRDGVIDTRRRR